MFVWQDNVCRDQDERDRRRRYSDGSKVSGTPMDYEPNVHQPVADYGVTDDAEKKERKEGPVPAVDRCLQD